MTEIRHYLTAAGKNIFEEWLVEYLRYYEKPMKDRASVSHDEVMVRKLRDNVEFAAEYLKAVIEDAEEPQVLTLALRQIAEARGGIAKVSGKRRLCHAVD